MQPDAQACRSSPDFINMLCAGAVCEAGCAVALPLCAQTGGGEHGGALRGARPCHGGGRSSGQLLNVIFLLEFWSGPLSKSSCQCCRTAVWRSAPSCREHVAPNLVIQFLLLIAAWSRVPPHSELGEVLLVREVDRRQMLWADNGQHISTPMGTAFTVVWLSQMPLKSMRLPSSSAATGCQ